MGGGEMDNNNTNYSLQGVSDSPIICLYLLISKEPLGFWLWFPSKFEVPAQVLPSFDDQVLHAISNQEWFYEARLA